MAWGVANQGQPQTEPPLKLDERELILVRAAAARPSGFIVDDNRFAIRLPSEDPSAVLLVEADTLAAGKKVVNKKGAELEKAGQHLHRSLELADLRASLTRLERSEKLQRALFAISELADSDGGMQEALRRVHSIVGELMYAENFYIVRYDVERDSVRFLYFADVMDPGPPTDGTEIAMSSLEHSPTWYLLRDTKPLRGSTAELRAQVSGPLVVRGPDSKDWVGVPMLRGGQTCGAVVAQCYRQGNRFTDEDRALLEFVGSHILTMIERKQGKRDLEQRVRQRTVDLDRANQVLQCEIAERRRTERLHATLFQIAQLTNIDISETDFYRHVHTGISELINAENFYIALISKSGDSLDFAYYIDKTEQTRPSRPLGPGLSEYVLQHGSALLRQPQILELVEQGIVLLDAVGGGPVPACWLGVPLVAGEKNIGLIVVQSYDDSAAYGASDLELFSFVATQVANSLQRRRSTEALHQAYAQLKQRVNERTQELNSRNAELEVAYAKLKDAQDQAVQSEKLASIGQLAAGVAHEINNPIGYVNSNLGTLQGYLSKLLVAIEGFAEIVRKGDPAAVAAGEAISKRADIAFLASDAPQLIRESREGIDRVCKIIRDLKDFSRRDRSEAWVRADLNEGLTSTLNIVSNQLKYKAQIIKTFGDLPLIECLPSELNQVFLNILINAGQAIKQNGIITVTTDCSADKVWVAIGDDGDGIPEDVLPRIFDPFFTTKPVGTGTGLGLAISYGIVAKHHGNIEVTSVPDQGTLFRIELPIQQPR